MTLTAIALRFRIAEQPSSLVGWVLAGNRSINSDRPYSALMAAIALRRLVSEAELLTPAWHSLVDSEIAKRRITLPGGRLQDY